MLNTVGFYMFEKSEIWYLSEASRSLSSRKLQPVIFEKISNPEIQES